MSKKEQDVMAQICSILASFIRDEDHSDSALLSMAENIMLSADGCSPQFFDRLYDKFHRTGANL